MALPWTQLVTATTHQTGDWPKVTVTAWTDLVVAADLMVRVMSRRVGSESDGPLHGTLDVGHTHTHTYTEYTHKLN